MRQKYFACDDAPKPQGNLYQDEPSTCKPSTWTHCSHCGRMVCPHKRTAGMCPECSPLEVQAKRVTAVYAGRLSAVVWRTEYGAYQSQPWPGYYRKKDGLEMLEAAKRLGLTAHLQERPRYIKWRDWHGRPCGYSNPEFYLWVEMDQTAVPAEIGRAIKAERNDARADVIGPLLRKRQSEWTYSDHETYHRYMGTL